MQVESTNKQMYEIDCDVFCVGIFEDIDTPGWIDERATKLIDSGVARADEGKITTLHGDEHHTLLVGLGKKDEFDVEKARVASANVRGDAERAGAGTLCWAVPDNVPQTDVAAALVEGLMLASYSFDRYKSDTSKDNETNKIEKLIIASDESIGDEIDIAVTVTESQNAARELQHLPSNIATPTYLANYASDLADQIEGLSVEILSGDEITKKKMGGIASVAQGSEQESQLITMRYKGDGAPDELLGIVGKAITFDSGGYSIKPAAKMHEMKMDMSGGAAAIEATATIARLKLPANVITVVPAAENMISGEATRPGDIVEMYSGKTVEVINTDAEGRMILADALAYAVELGADKIVDLATLTGAIITALGSTYAGVMSNDNDLVDSLIAAGNKSGELLWQLPIHEEYFELTKGTVSDLVNASDARKAGPLYAAAFLQQFVNDKTWAHIDIAGTAWDVGRSYVGKGPTGFGVRLLVEFVRELN